MYFHRKLQKSSKLSRKSLCKLKFRSLISGNLKISVRVMYTTRQKTSTFTMRPQSCPTLHDPMDCSPPSFSVHGIFQARILEWVAISKSKGSSWHRDWSCVSCVSNWQVGSSPLTLPKSEVAQSCPTLWDPLDCSLPGSSVHGISHDKSTGVGCHFLLRGIFPTRGLDLGLLHCRQMLYHLSHQGSPLLSVVCDQRDHRKKTSAEDLQFHYFPIIWLWLILERRPCSYFLNF